MIFISHCHADNPVVEPIALHLRDILGEDNVFFDLWSIKPGDGIIERMNQGLTSPEYVFVFLSEKSLTSEMVKLEWQTALYKATRGQCKIVPVRVNNALIPAVLMQSLYIDMFNIGIDATITKVMSVVQGGAKYVPQYSNFSNLTWSVYGDPNDKLIVTILASHLFEASARFGFILKNDLSDFTLWPTGAPIAEFPGGEQIISLGDGAKGALKFCCPAGGGSISPNFPISFTITAMNGARLSLASVLHEKRANQYESIPLAAN